MLVYSTVDSGVTITWQIMYIHGFRRFTKRVCVCMHCMYAPDRMFLITTAETQGFCRDLIITKEVNFVRSAHKERHAIKVNRNELTANAQGVCSD